MKSKFKSKSKCLFPILISLIFLSTFFFVGSKEGYAIGRSLSFAFMLCLSVFFGVFFRRIGLGVLTGSLLTVSVLLISELKAKNMGIAFNYSDISFYAASPMETLRLFYEFVSLRTFFALSVFALCFGFLLRFLMVIEKPMIKLNQSWKVFAWPFFLILIYFGSGLAIKSYAIHLYKTPENLAKVTMTQAPSVSGFVASLNISDIEIPVFKGVKKQFEGYFQKGVSKISGISELPNIVVWLQESTFDPSVVNGCVFEECKSTLFKANSLYEFAAPLNVHTWGGGTWTSEFSFLTGLDHRMFGPLGGSAPITLAPRMNSALPIYLNSLGYETIALYPVNKSYLNAGPAYRSYGFKQVIDVMDEGFGDSWESSDSDLLELLKKVLERQKKDKPLFVFMLTIYQHGPHLNSNLKPLPKDYKPVNNTSISRNLNENLNNYLSRMKMSEKVTSDAEKYFDEFFKNKKWIFTHFGDHQPTFGAESQIAELYSEEVKRKYSDLQHLTYFKSKANFKLPRIKYGKIDLSYLGNLTLSLAGVPLSGLFEANQVLMDKCDGAYMSCKDTEVWASYNNYIFDKLEVIQR